MTNKKEMRKEEKMEIKREELLNAVRKAGLVVKGRSTIPIIDNVLIISKAGKIIVRGTDLENTISTNFDSDKEFEPIAVDPHKLVSMLSSITTEMVVIELVEGLMTLKSGKTKFNLPTMDGKEFPGLTDIDELKTLGVIKEYHLNIMNTASSYVGIDDLRPVMKCLALYVDTSTAKMRIVATDAHKLVEFTTDINSQNDIEKPLLIPGQSVKLFKKLFNKDVTIRYDNTNVYLSQDGVSVIARQSDGKYPNYKGVIPTDNPVKMTFDKSELLEALKTTGITLNVSNTIKIDVGRMDAIMSAEDLDFNYSSVVPIGVLYEGAEDKFVIGVNHKFLTQVVKDIDANEIIIEGSTPQRAMVINSSTEKYDITSLVMPVMLNE